MNKEKQIEEMAKVICLSYGKGVCRQCNDYEDCTVRQEAERLYNAGYRKASDVAREIFEEIENFFKRLDIEYGYFLRDVKNDIAELKKKCTENKDVKSIYKHYTNTGAVYITSEPQESEVKQ